MDDGNVWLSGIDFGQTANGGPECLKHTSTADKTMEALISLLPLGWGLYVGYPAVSLKNPAPPPGKQGAGLRRFVLVCLLLTLGAEVTYKVLTRQLIFILNPCHVISCLQVYLLQGADFPRLRANLFKVHVFFMHGPVVALLSPVTFTRKLPGEVAVFWVQHGIMLVVPALCIVSGRYAAPKWSLGDLTRWTLFSWALFCLYHLLILMPLSVATAANLGTTLCPLDQIPFRGPHYRLYALSCQLIAMAVVGTAYSWLGKRPKGPL